MSIYKQEYYSKSQILRYIAASLLSGFLIGGIVFTKWNAGNGSTGNELDEYRQSLMTAYEYNPPLTSDSDKNQVNFVTGANTNSMVAPDFCRGRTDIPLGWKKSSVKFKGLGVQYPEFTLERCDKKFDLSIKKKFGSLGKVSIPIKFTVPLFRLKITTSKQRFRLSFPVPDQETIGKEISDCIQMSVYMSFASLPASPGTIASIFANTLMNCMSKFSDSLDLSDFPCKVGVETEDVEGNTLAKLSLC